MAARTLIRIQVVEYPQFIDCLAMSLVVRPMLRFGFASVLTLPNPVNTIAGIVQFWFRRIGRLLLAPADRDAAVAARIGVL